MLIDPGLDGHVHTSLCNHASGGMEDYVRSALAAGLHTIVFLEHLEAGIRYDERTWLEREHFDRYFIRGQELQQRYQGRITIKLGVEVGYNPKAVAELQRVLNDYPFAWRGLSYHFYENGGRHYNMVSRRQENISQLTRLGLERVLDGYLEGLLEGIATMGCNVLCHMDAALRHCPGVHFSAGQRRSMGRILEQLTAHGMALEYNTSGFAIRGEAFPARDILNQARELAVPLVAGSDAHRPEQVGRYFDRLPSATAPR